MKKVLITGAAGNLGGLLAESLLKNELILNLLVHNKEPKQILQNASNTKVFRADLAKKESLFEALKGVDVVVHFAGVLFMHHPEKFLPETNTQYFQNLLEVSIECNVSRIILISFPHVEGESSPENPAEGKLDGNPNSMHAKTRLEEEKLLFHLTKNTVIEPVSLRLGMVYGKGILMIDAARWFSKHHLLGIWEKPTWVHLISISDYLESTKNAILNNNISGIYYLGDDGKQTLQDFLDIVTKYWGYKKPIRMNENLIFFAANTFEFFSLLFHIKSPLTKDFIKIGMVSYYGNTERMKQELLPELKYKTFKEGIHTL